MAQTANFTWGQGEDLTIALIYKEGTAGSEAVIDLSSGYELRMDIVVPTTKERVTTFNSSALDDADPIQVGDQADVVVESLLSSGSGGAANILISVPRILTLPGGGIYTKMTAGTPIHVFAYDIFLRNTVSDKQVKILTGTVTVEESNTLWL